MATITPTWTIAQSLFVTSSLGNGEQISGAINADALNFDILDVQVKASFEGSPDGPVFVELFSSVKSGDEIANIADSSLGITQVTCSNEIAVFKGLIGPHYTITATNSDSADNVSVEGTFAGRQWSSV